MKEKFLDKALFVLLILIVATLPLQVSELLFPAHFLGSTFPVLEVSRLLTGLGVVVLGISFLRTRKLILPKDVVSVLLYIFVGLSIISVAVFYSGSGLREVVRYGFYLGFLILIANSIRSWGDLEVVWKYLIGSGLVIALFAIFQYLSGSHLWGPGLDSVLGRVNATFFDPNVLATFLGIVILFSVSYYSQAEEKIGQMLGGLTAVVSLVALFYTFSRGGLVSLAVSGLVLILLLPKSLKMAALYLVLVSTAFLTSSTATAVGGRVVNIFEIVESRGASEQNYVDQNPTQQSLEDGGDTSGAEKYEELVDRIIRPLPLNRDRRAMVKAGALMLIDNPVFGVGLGNFQSAYTGDYSFLIKAGSRKPVTLSHTSFVTLAAEQGIVGILWFLSFVGAFSWLVFSTFRKKIASRSFVLAVGASMLLFILHTQIRGGLFSDPYFWLLNGFLVVMGRIVTKEFQK